MAHEPNKQGAKRQRALREFRDAVQIKASRKKKARQDTQRDVWFWLGMLGMVGWSVAIPTLLGIALGVWIDKTWPSRYSWTLMLLVAGVALGCLNAWHWVSRESGSDQNPPDRGLT